MSDPCNAYQLTHWLNEYGAVHAKAFFFSFSGSPCCLSLLALSKQRPLIHPYVYTTYNLQEGLAVIMEIRMRGGR